MAQAGHFPAPDFLSNTVTPSPLSDVPPLPPRPRMLTESIGVRNSRNERSVRKASLVMKKHVTVQAATPEKSHAMTLSEFVSAFSDRLPLIITACSGYYGKNSHMQISTGESLYAHLTKVTDVVMATTQIGTETYSIPLNSSYKFAVVYNPKGNISEAMEGYTFKGVKSLAGAKPLPRVVCAKTPWTKEGKMSVEENEVFVVTERKALAKELEVFSVSTGQVKMLPFSCKAKFTTNPQALYMYLLDMVSSNLSRTFPCHVILQHNTDANKLFGSQHLTLLSTTSETTLLCSYPGSVEHFDFPTNLPGVTVSVSGSTEVDMSQLYESTKNIIGSYNPAYGMCCRDDVDKSVYETQSKIYATIREGYENTGVYLNVSRDILGQVRGRTNGLALLPEPIQSATPLCAPLPPVQEDIDSGTKERMKQANRNFLASLSAEMVTQMINFLGLPQYEEAFRSLEGADMCKMTDQTLDSQLGVKSKLHRIRIMKYVSGESDVRELL